MKTFSKSTGLSLILVAAFLVAGCSSVYYSAYEKFGVYKRDLLKKRVVEARDDQKAAQEQFKDAMTRLKEITGFDGGQLEKTYNSLKSEYDDCVKRADAVHKRVREVETVANDMFEEWRQENSQIGTASLRESSQQQLVDTQQRYNELHAALKTAEQSMTPVLSQFNDYVLYLKHDLNAQAIDSLKGQSASIQGDISKLIDQMNRSISRADEFVKNMK